MDLLREFSQDLEALMDAIRDTLALAGNEAYNAGLLVYGSAKAVTKNNVPGAESVVRDLSARFTGNQGKKGTD